MNEFIPQDLLEFKPQAHKSNMGCVGPEVCRVILIIVIDWEKQGQCARITRNGEERQERKDFRHSLAEIGKSRAHVLKPELPVENRLATRNCEPVGSLPPFRRGHDKSDT